MDFNEQPSLLVPFLVDAFPPLSPPWDHLPDSNND